MSRKNNQEKLAMARKRHRKKMRRRGVDISNSATKQYPTMSQTSEVRQEPLSAVHVSEQERECYSQFCYSPVFPSEFGELLWRPRG